MAKKKHPAGTPALQALLAAGIAFEPVEYTHHGDSHDFGAEAARETGIDPARLYKTLIVSIGPHQLAVDQQTVLVAHRVSPLVVRSVCGGAVCVVRRASSR